MSYSIRIAATAAALVLGPAAPVLAASPQAVVPQAVVPQVASPQAAPPREIGVQPPLVNEQLVTATLNASGLPTEAQLINRIVATDLPAQEVVATTATGHIRYLDRAGSPPVSGDTVNYPVGGNGQTSVSTEADFGKPLPVALHAEYATVGEGSKGVNPDSVASRNGELTVTYTVTNTAVQTQQLSYRDAGGKLTTQEQPVFAPFVGTMIATLPRGIELQDAGTAVVTTNQNGTTSLLWNLVLYPPLGNFQQVVDFRINGSPLAVPSVRMEVVPVSNDQDPAVGFSAGLLDQSVAGNTKLAGGLKELDSSTQQLARGARDLARAQSQVTSGTRQAARGSADLEVGTQALSDGLVNLSEGLDQLAGANGLPLTVPAVNQLASAVSTIADSVGNASNPLIPPTPPFPPKLTLVQASRLASAASAGLAAVAGSAATDSANTVASLTAAYAQLCSDPSTPGCAQLQAALVSATAAAAKSTAVATGLAALNTQVLSRITTGLLQVSAGLKSLSTTNPGVYEHLQTLEAKLAEAVAATKSLSDGADQASTSAGSLVTGASNLESGLAELARGSNELLAGSRSLASGADQLQTDGTEKILHQVIDSSTQPALADAYLRAASERATDAAPYPAPKGAVARVAYVYALDPPAPLPSLNPAVVGLGLVTFAAIALVVVRRIRQPATNP